MPPPEGPVAAAAAPAHRARGLGARSEREFFGLTPRVRARVRPRSPWRLPCAPLPPPRPRQGVDDAHFLTFHGERLQDAAERLAEGSCQPFEAVQGLIAGGGRVGGAPPLPPAPPDVAVPGLPLRPDGAAGAAAAADPLLAVAREAAAGRAAAAARPRHESPAANCRLPAAGAHPPAAAAAIRAGGGPPPAAAAAAAAPRLHWMRDLVWESLA